MTGLACIGDAPAVPVVFFLNFKFDKSLFVADGSAVGFLIAMRALVAFPAVAVISIGSSRVCHLRGGPDAAPSVLWRFIGTVEVLVTGLACCAAETSATSGEDFSENKEPAESLSSPLSLLRISAELFFCNVCQICRYRNRGMISAPVQES